MIGHSSGFPSIVGAVDSRRAASCGPSTGRSETVATGIAGGAATAGVDGPAEVTDAAGVDPAGAPASGVAPDPPREIAKTTAATTTAATAAAMPITRPRDGPVCGVGG